jgi:hypothetical protein
VSRCAAPPWSATFTSGSCACVATRPYQSWPSVSRESSRLRSLSCCFPQAVGSRYLAFACARCVPIRLTTSQLGLGLWLGSYVLARADFQDTSTSRSPATPAVPRPPVFTSASTAATRTVPAAAATSGARTTPWIHDLWAPAPSARQPTRQGRAQVLRS